MRRAWIQGTVACVALGFAAVAAADLRIERVRHSRGAFDPAAGETVDVDFRLTRSASASLEIYDGRGLRIRQVQSPGELPRGEHRLSWDGRDALGRPVPPEAYQYTVTAKPPGGPSVVHDLTDLTGTEALPLAPPDWDVDAKTIRFRLSKPARVQIRLGLTGDGPLLRTLVDWVPRPAGAQAEPWDGFDNSGLLDLSRHPKLGVTVRAISLPDNTILVLPRSQEIQLIDVSGFDAPVRPETPQSRRSQRLRRVQAVDAERDIGLSLELPAGLRRTTDGVPVITEPVAVRLRADREDLPRILSERFETVFYVDGFFRFENSVGFLPTTWRWDPKDLGPGLHYITANVLGYQGHFGITTSQVWVEASPDATASSTLSSREPQ
ncbi:MAG: hypothetical protein MJE66_15660 [Proteobacteria bacterium]|nr:hypothetical protein [Pseudomonadota bacterium]